MAPEDDVGDRDVRDERLGQRVGRAEDQARANEDDRSAAGQRQPGQAQAQSGASRHRPGWSIGQRGSASVSWPSASKPIGVTLPAISQRPSASSLGKSAALA